METPILQPIYGGANARPFTTYHNSLKQNLFLRIADELYLKRLIIGGFERVYEISKDFRNEGVDRSHNPEFTMLEFYMAFSDYNDCMEIVESLIAKVSKAIGKEKVNVENKKIDLTKPFKKISYFQLLKEETGYDLEESSEKDLKNICIEKGIEPKSI